MCWPSPAELLAQRRAGKIITVALPGGRDVRLGEYLRSWKRLQTLAPNLEVAHWNWYPVSAGEILSAISRGIHDRINGHLPWFRYSDKPHAGRIAAKLDDQVRAGVLKCECRWCGQSLDRYQPRHRRFCCADCRHSYSL